MNTLSILVVEDSELHQKAARAQLGHHNLTIVHDFASFGEEWKKGGWDAVLTDLNFPVNSGFDYQSPYNGLNQNQPQPIGSIVILMAQHAGIPVRMLSDHGDTVNYALEKMGLVLNGSHWFHVDTDTFLPPTKEQVLNSLVEKWNKETDQKKKDSIKHLIGSVVCMPEGEDRYTRYYESPRRALVKNWKLALEELGL